MSNGYVTVLGAPHVAGNVGLPRSRIPVANCNSLSGLQNGVFNDVRKAHSWAEVTRGRCGELDGVSAARVGAEIVANVVKVALTLLEPGESLVHPAFLARRAWLERGLVVTQMVDDDGRNGGAGRVSVLQVDRHGIGGALNLENENPCKVLRRMLEIYRSTSDWTSSSVTVDELSGLVMSELLSSLSHQNWQLMAKSAFCKVHISISKAE